MQALFGSLKQIWQGKRISRLPYAFISVLAFFAVLSAGGVHPFVQENWDLFSAGTLSLISISSFSILLTWLTVKRVRDIGLNGFFTSVLLGGLYLFLGIGSLIGLEHLIFRGYNLYPFYHIAQFIMAGIIFFLSTKQGDKGRNKYGDNPQWMKNNRVKVRDFIKEGQVSL